MEIHQPRAETINLRLRILLPLLTSALALFAAFIIFIHHEEQKNLRADMEQCVCTVTTFYQRVVQERGDKQAIALTLLSHNEVLNEALARGDREELLRLGRPIFEELRRHHNITHLYFHGPDRVNILRVHQPTRHGDLINRITALEAERTQNFASGMELGPLGTFTLRTVMPQTRNGRLIGYLELGEEIDHIIHDMHQAFKFDFVVLLDKKFLDRQRWEEGMRMLARPSAWEQFPELVVAAQTMADLPPGLHDLLLDFAALPPGEVEIPQANRRYWAQFVPLPDAADRVVGRFVVMRDMTARLAATQTGLQTMVGAGLAAGLLLVVFFHRILRRSENLLLASQCKIIDRDAELIRAQSMAGLGSWQGRRDQASLHLSEEARHILGLPAGEPNLTCEDLLGFVHPDDRLSLLDLFEAACATRQMQEIQHRIIRRDGATRIIRHQVQASRESAAADLRLNGTMQDITAQKQAEQLALRFGRIIENSWDEIYFFDENSLRFIQVSNGALRNLGYSMTELRGMTPLDLNQEISSEEFAARLQPLREQRQNQLRFETSHCRKDGSRYPVEVRLQLSHSETPPVFVAIIQDISDRKAHLATLERLALYDHLTGLPNRIALQERLRDELHTSPPPPALALLILDLDRLQEINDIMGHQAGDLLLTQVAKRFTDRFADQDFVARVSGDEFAVLARGADQEKAIEIAKEMQALLHQHFMIKEMPINVEASIGIALYPEHGADDSTLLQHADVAVRLCKQGKFLYRFYSGADDPFSLHRLRLFGELRAAIHQGQLRLHYQPKVEIASGRVIGVEALVRWIHPERGLISPAEFIPLAEQTGLIRPLTSFVLSEAIHQWVSWQRQGINLRIAVNLSTRNLLDISLPTEIAGYLKQAGLAGDRLTLEITESAIMAQPENALLVLNLLRDMGVSLALDDFGTGYSSLGYLKRLPVDELKIDRTFVAGMTSDENDRMIVSSTIDLGHNLGLKVVAEGVEDEPTWELLKKLGCDAIQGFYLGRPMPPDELPAWLRTKS